MMKKNVVEKLKEAQERCNHYVELGKEGMGLSDDKEKHDFLCRLMAMIAKEYPHYMAKDPGSLLRCEWVTTQNHDGLELKRERFGFSLFCEGINSFYDHQQHTADAGYPIFQLTQALWYEIWYLRDRLQLRGITYDEMSPLQSLPPHFNISEDVASMMFTATQTLNWFGGEVDKNNWMYRLTGKLPSELTWTPSPDPIMFDSINKIHYIAKNYIYPSETVDQTKWDIVCTVFNAKNGKIKGANKAYKDPTGCNVFEKIMNGEDPIKFMKG